MLRKQVQLWDSESHSVMYAWLPVDKRIRKGVRLTLKEIPDVWWEVIRVYSVEMEESYFHRKWNFDHYEQLKGLDIKPA